MTVRELRQMLTEVVNQDMTVKELRKVLFDLEDQEEELTDVGMMKITSNSKEA